jgi:hypothetical protein
MTRATQMARPVLDVREPCWPAHGGDPSNVRPPEDRCNASVVRRPEHWREHLQKPWVATPRFWSVEPRFEMCVSVEEVGALRVHANRSDSLPPQVSTLGQRFALGQTWAPMRFSGVSSALSSRDRRVSRIRSTPRAPLGRREELGGAGCGGAEGLARSGGDLRRNGGVRHPRAGLRGGGKSS